MCLVHVSCSVLKCFFGIRSSEDLIMPTTPTEGGIAWSLEINKGRQRILTRERKSVSERVTVSVRAQDIQAIGKGGHLCQDLNAIPSALGHE